MKEETKIDLQFYYGELLQLSETRIDFFEVKCIKKKIKAIEILLNINEYETNKND